LYGLVVACSYGSWAEIPTQNSSFSNKHNTGDVKKVMSGSSGIVLAALVTSVRSMKEEAAKLNDEEKEKWKKVKPVLLLCID
jgi:hypothetical protein